MIAMTTSNSIKVKAVRLPPGQISILILAFGSYSAGPGPLTAQTGHVSRVSLFSRAYSELNRKNTLPRVVSIGTTTGGVSPPG